MSKIRADLITQVHTMEDKMGNCMGAIREELKTQIGDLCLVNYSWKRGWISYRKMSPL
jgi:hypothetical protein